MPLIVLPATTPTLLLNPNSKRRKLVIQMQPSDIDANNLERIHLGFGSQPIGTVGHPNQGLIIIGGAGIEEPSGDAPIDKKYQQAVWAVSSAVNQSLTVDEEVSET